VLSPPFDTEEWGTWGDGGEDPQKVVPSDATDTVPRLVQEFPLWLRVADGLPGLPSYAPRGKTLLRKVFSVADEGWEVTTRAPTRAVRQGYCYFCDFLAANSKGNVHHGPGRTVMLRVDMQARLVLAGFGVGAAGGLGGAGGGAGLGSARQGQHTEKMVCG
jgi:hypothetical protein